MDAPHTPSPASLAAVLAHTLQVVRADTIILEALLEVDVSADLLDIQTVAPPEAPDPTAASVTFGLTLATGEVFDVTLTRRETGRDREGVPQP